MFKISFVFISFILISCSLDKMNDCVGSSGSVTYQSIELDSFLKLNINEGIEVELIQNPIHKIEIEVGQHIKKYIEYTVINQELFLSNRLTCSVGFPPAAKIKVYTPNLTDINTVSQYNLTSNQIFDADTLYIGSGVSKKTASCVIKLNIKANNLTIESGNLTFFELTGYVNNFSIIFWGGNSRLEAQNLISQHVNLFQRSSNHMYLNPIQSIKGQIYSNANVYVNQFPNLVDVTSYNKGKLILQP
jgi:hypothetical protein